MRDGTSNTLMLSEMLVHLSGSDNSWGLWAYPGGATISGSNHNDGTTTLLINSDARDPTQKNWTPPAQRPLRYQ
jgi:hypothetical protein